MRVICAPDSFKGSISATEAAAAMAKGIARSLPGATIDTCPVGDGGEGTLAALNAAMPGHSYSVRVANPIGELVTADLSLFEGGRRAAIEAASAVGLLLLDGAARNPLRTSSFGVGELLAGACDLEPEQVLVCVGGTATNDGGCGMAQAIGIRFFDRHGKPIDAPIAGGALSSIGHIDATARSANVDQRTILGLIDVTNPLTGTQGAAAVFAPQKGAAAADVDELDAGLRHLARIVRRDLGIDIESTAGTGAGGGLGGGLVAFAGASLVSGIETVLEAIDFDARVSCCDLCLTGEGRIDAQTMAGKACIGVARAARRHGVPTVALVGSVGDGAEHCLDAGLDDYVRIGDGLSEAESMRDAASLLAQCAGSVAATLLS